MRNLIVALFLAFAIPSAVTALDNDLRMVAGVDGLPLMPGLEEDESARVVFDKPQGRIIDAQADGEVSEGEAATWYRTRLAELGWEAVVPNLTGGILVQRESEVLHIRFRQETLERLDVHYSIEPLAEPDAP